MKHFAFSMLLGIVLFGCASEEVPMQDNSSQEIAKEAVLTVINNPQQIGASELAEYAAKALKGNGVKSRSTSAGKVTEVYSDKNGSGIYVVNFGENDGFVLLTTQQKMHPVVAMSETGHFDVASLEGSPIQLWLKDVELAISHPDEIPDSVVVAAKQEWNKLQSTEVMLSAQSRSVNDDNIYNTINQAISQWRREGYSVTRVSDAYASNYPESIANAVTQLQNNHSVSPNPAETSFILTKTTQNVTRNFPEIKTTWHQGYPYNYTLPNNSDYQNLIGCAPVAIAQIMNYHKKPTSIDFSQFPDYMNNPVIALCDFLKEVGITCGIDYTIKGKHGVNTSTTISVLSFYGYSCRYIDFDHYTILTSLQNGPVFMSGKIEGGDYHAWVCDGANAGSSTTEYIVKSYTGDFADIDASYAFMTKASENVTSTIPASYHMIWGGVSGNGWYYGTDWTFTSGLQTFRIHKDIKALVDIIPN